MKLYATLTVHRRISHNSSKVNKFPCQRPLTPLQPKEQFFTKRGGRAGSVQNMGCIQSLPLRQAVREEDHDRVVYLLRNNQKAQKLALIMAVQADSVDMVRLLLKYGVEINMRDKTGQTALMHAVVPRSEKMFKRQKQVKKMIDKQSESEGDRDSLLSSIKSIMSDFKSACSHSRLRDHNHTEICKLLLENGVDVNLVDHEGCSALIHATAFGNLEGVKCLIDCNADLNVADKEGSTALICGSSWGYTDVVKCLIDANADLNISDKEGRTALIFATSCGHTDIVRSLIDAKANVNSVDIDGNTALLYASSFGDRDILKYLIDASADVNVVNKYGNTALMCASSWGHTDIVNCLIDAKADVNAVGKDGNTPLMLATIEGYANIAKSLIDANADLNIANTDGNTALMWAANKGFANIAKFLVDAKADLNIVNRYGNSALHVALGSNSAHIAEIILSSGENVNIDSVNNQGKTPLFYARLYSYESVTQTLIRCGANQALAELLIQREGPGHHEPSSKDSGFDSVYKGVRTVYRGVRLRNMLDSISEFDV